METDELLTPFILLTIAFSVAFTKSLQEIERSIQEFPNKLFTLLTHPNFIITIFSIAFLGIIFLIHLRHKSRKDYKKWEPEKEEIVKELPQKKVDELDYEDNCDEDINEIDEEDDIDEEEAFEPMPIGTYRRSISIKVDSNKRYFHKKNITKHEVKYLLNEDYQIKKYKNLLSGKMEDFLLQPRHNESFTHLFLTHNISEFLEKNGIETQLFITKKPDIVFEVQGKKFAIEIETGSIFSKISRMKEKLKVLENYNKWFFVVTDRNKVKKYKKYGNTVDKRYVKPRLEKIIKSAKKPKNRTLDFGV